jgi:hypothetical protein
MAKAGTRSGRIRAAVRTLVAALVALSASAGATPKEFALAVAAAGRGDHAACRAEFERLASASSQDGFARRALYGGAVCAAQGGELDRAFALLDQALARGFHDKERFYFDPRLVAVRTDPRFPGLERRFVAAFSAWKGAQNAELAKLVGADQDDRKGGVGGIDWSFVAPRDRERGARVKQIVAEGGARTPDDKYNAALVLQHGEELADFELAHRLAREAAEADADLPGARWLAAAALDRSLVQAGKPQRYGTQSIRKEGRWLLAEVDPTVTDEERALWDVPPLAESRKRAEAMNAAHIELPKTETGGASPPARSSPANGRGRARRARAQGFL